MPKTRKKINKTKGAPKTSDAPPPEGLADAVLKNDSVMETIASYLNPEDLSYVRIVSRLFNKQLTPQRNHSPESSLANMIFLQKYIRQTISLKYFSFLYSKNRLVNRPDRVDHFQYHYYTEIDINKKNTPRLMLSKKIDNEDKWIPILEGDFKTAKTLLVDKNRQMVFLQKIEEHMLIEHVALLRMIFANLNQFHLDQTFKNIHDNRYQFILDAFYDECIKNNKVYEVTSSTIGTDNNGMTLLHWTILCHQPLELIEPLINLNNNLLHKKSKHNEDTPLHFAVLYRCHIESLITKQAELNAVNHLNITPLHLATKLGDISTCHLLIKHHANVNAAQSDGNTAMHIAAYNGDIALCQLFIKNNADLNILNSSNQTPLLAATYTGRTEICQLFIAHDAGVNIADKNGNTPLYYSAYHNDAVTTALLIEKGAKINVANEFYLTILQIAAINNSIDVCEILLKNAADVDAVDHRKSTALIYAAKKQLAEMCRLLIENHADINKADHDGNTPLCIAAMNNDITTFELLISCNAKVNLANNNHLTPLHYAAINNNADFCQQLLAAGADVNARDTSDRTPLDLAEEAGNLAIVNLLNDPLRSYFFH